MILDLAVSRGVAGVFGGLRPASDKIAMMVIGSDLKSSSPRVVKSLVQLHHIIIRVYYQNLKFLLGRYVLCAVDTPLWHKGGLHRHNNLRPREEKPRASGSTRLINTPLGPECQVRSSNSSL